MRNFSTTRTSDPEVNRNLDAIAAHLTDLSTQQPAQGFIGGATAMFVETGTLSSAYLNIFAGGAGKTLTLPGAMSAGPGFARVLVIRNDSASSVALALGPGDALVGSATVNAGVTALFVSDGNMRWLRVV